VNIDYALSREKRLDFRYRLKRRTEEVLRAIGRHAPSAQSIIDLGTAEGKMLREIKRRYPSSWCLGVDYSLPLLLFGRKQSRDIPMVCADVQNPTFIKSGTFDVIVAAAVIEHLISPQDMLRETVRLLCPGGILIITSPHPFWEKVSGTLGWVKGITIPSCPRAFSGPLPECAPDNSGSLRIHDFAGRFMGREEHGSRSPEGEGRSIPAQPFSGGAKQDKVLGLTDEDIISLIRKIRLNRELRLILAFSLIAFIFKLLLLSQRSLYIDPDEGYYLLLARNLVHGNGYGFNGLRISYSRLFFRWQSLLFMYYFIISSSL